MSKARVRRNGADQQAVTGSGVTTTVKYIRREYSVYSWWGQSIQPWPGHMIRIVTVVFVSIPSSRQPSRHALFFFHKFRGHCRRSSCTSPRDAPTDESTQNQKRPPTSCTSLARCVYLCWSRNSRSGSTEVGCRNDPGPLQLSPFPDHMHPIMASNRYCTD